MSKPCSFHFLLKTNLIFLQVCHLWFDLIDIIPLFSEFLKHFYSACCLFGEVYFTLLAYLCSCAPHLYSVSFLISWKSFLVLFLSQSIILLCISLWSCQWRLRMTVWCHGPAVVIVGCWCLFCSTRSSPFCFFFLLVFRLQRKKSPCMYFKCTPLQQRRLVVRRDFSVSPPLRSHPLLLLTKGACSLHSAGPEASHAHCT